jgi:hypothetical protein
MRLATLRVLTTGLVLAQAAAAVTIGQIDTFESGTTEGWVAGGGPMTQVPPTPPFNQPSGGPGGIDDAYLQITSGGGDGPGSRLTAFNILSQWADNYLTNGIRAIEMDLINLGTSDLTIRLEFENPLVATPDFAVTKTGIFLPAGSGWTHAVFPIGAGDFTSLGGTVAGALGNTTVLRILHAPGETAAVPAAGVLGVDNIEAVVPEPATLGITSLALLCLYGSARAARRRIHR